MPFWWIPQILLISSCEKQFTWCCSLALAEIAVLTRCWPLPASDYVWGWMGSLKLTFSNPPAQAGSLGSGLPMTMSRQLLNISKDGDLFNHSGQLVPLSNHTPSNWVSWRSDGALCMPGFAHCLLACHWAPWESAWLYSLYCFLQVFVHTDKIAFQPSLLQDEKPHLSQPFLIGEILQSLNYLHNPSLGLCCSSISLLCSTPAVASPVLSRREGPHPSTRGQPRPSLSFNTKLIKSLS